MPLILDVDTGIDDALAIALALADPRAEVVAVTTLAGNIRVEQVIVNTLEVLRVPWAPIISRSIAERASRWFGICETGSTSMADDGLGEPEIPAVERALAPDRGPAAIIRLARERPGELTLVCQGPLTNLAIALNVAPELPGLLKSVVVMGGAFGIAGNMTPHAEFNIHADPEAAVEVFANRLLDITVVGLDVSHQVAMPKAVWEGAAESSSPYAQLVAKVCGWIWRGHRRNGMFLHDPLAVAVALDSTLVGTVSRSVTVSCQPENLGETRAVRAGTIKVAETVEAERFLRLFSETLGLPWVSADLSSLQAV